MRSLAHTRAARTHTHSRPPMAVTQRHGQSRGQIHVSSSVAIPFACKCSVPSFYLLTLCPLIVGTKRFRCELAELIMGQT